MKCPYCGKDMKGGFLRASGMYGAGVYWSTAGGWWDKDDMIRTSFRPVRIEAMRCTDCKAVLFRY